MAAIQQYRIDRAVALRAVAVAAQRPDRSKTIRPITPVLRQATVVTIDATTPPTCTIQYDAVTPGPTHPLTAFPANLALTGGDIVYVAVLGNGDAWVLTKMAGGVVASSKADAAASASTTSTSYVGLTGGPAVTVSLEAGHTVKVTVYARISNSPGGSGHQSYMSWAVSGADAQSAVDADAIETQTVTAGPGQKSGLYTAASSGDHTFTAQYKATSGDTATFVNRRILVEP